jgi:hypothetical protein
MNKNFIFCGLLLNFNHNILASIGIFLFEKNHKTLLQIDSALPQIIPSKI